MLSAHHCMSPDSPETLMHCPLCPSFQGFGCCIVQRWGSCTTTRAFKNSSKDISAIWADGSKQVLEGQELGVFSTEDSEVFKR